MVTGRRKKQSNMMQKEEKKLTGSIFKCTDLVQICFCIPYRAVAQNGFSFKRTHHQDMSKLDCHRFYANSNSAVPVIISRFLLLVSSTSYEDRSPVQEDMLATPKMSVSKPRCSICCHQQSTNLLLGSRKLMPFLVCKKVIKMGLKSAIRWFSQAFTLYHVGCFLTTGVQTNAS